MEQLKHSLYDGCMAGQSKTMLMPDTLTLTDRMQLAIHALTHVWDPKEKWALYFMVDYSKNPPEAFANHYMDAYLNIPPKFLEALALCRSATGSTAYQDVDLAVWQVQLDLIGEDGLTYAPDDVLTKLLATNQKNFGITPPYSESWGEGRSLMALSALIQINTNPLWKDLAKRKIDRLLELTKEKDGYLVLPFLRWKPGATLQPGDEIPYQGRPDDPDKSWDDLFTLAYSTGAIGYGAGLIYQLTGYEPAYRLCQGIAKWALTYIFFREDGSYQPGHFHHMLFSLLNVFEYGLISKDAAILEQVNRSYLWLREMGDTVSGFFPELVPGAKEFLLRTGNSAEICEIAHMILLALHLSCAGIADHWDDVDRWTRNLFTEAQILDAHALDHLDEHYFRKDLPEDAGKLDFARDPNNPDFPGWWRNIGERPYATQDSVAERSVGAFLGWFRLNDGLLVSHGSNYNQKGDPIIYELGIQQCCTANGSRVLYYLWDAMLTEDTEDVTVNLLINRVGKRVDVLSFIPAEGRVIVRLKDARSLRVRIPEWCQGKTAVTVNGTLRSPLVQGAYLSLPCLASGDEVVLTMEIKEHLVHRVVGEIPYRLTLRGHNIVHIDPPGEAWPLFTHQPSGKLVEKTVHISPVTTPKIW